MASEKPIGSLIETLDGALQASDQILVKTTLLDIQSEVWRFPADPWSNLFIFELKIRLRNPFTISSGW